MWHVNRTPYFISRLNQLHRRVKTAINEFRNERWNNFAESFSTADNADNAVLKTASRIRRTCIHTPAINGLNVMAYANTEKAEAIAKSLRSQFSPNSDLYNWRVPTVLESTVQIFL